MSERRGGGIGELREVKGGSQVERSNRRHVKGRQRENEGGVVMRSAAGVEEERVIGHG